MEKLAENDLTYFYLRHAVIVVATVTTISLTPVTIIRHETETIFSYKVEDSRKIVQLFRERTYSAMLHLRLNYMLSFFFLEEKRISVRTAQERSKLGLYFILLVCGLSLYL